MGDGLGFEGPGIRAIRERSVTYDIIPVPVFVERECLALLIPVPYLSYDTSTTYYGIYLVSLARMRHCDSDQRRLDSISAPPLPNT